MYRSVDGVEVNDSGHVVAGCRCTHTTIPAECVSECMYRFVSMRVCVWGGGGGFGVLSGGVGGGVGGGGGVG